MAAAAPENTLEAMQLAFGYGADAVEFDLRLSADGEVVVIHDATVDRTTDGNGLVASKTTAELRELDAGARFIPGRVEDRTPPPMRDAGERFYPEYAGLEAARRRNVRIPLFREVLERFGDRSLLIEIKDPHAATPACRLIEKFGARARCLVDSYHASALPEFRQAGIPVGAGKEGVVSLLKSFAFLQKSQLQYNGMCVPTEYNGIPLPVRILTRIARKAARTVHVWTINSPREARTLWKVGVNGIISDDVRPIIAEREKR